MDAPLRTGTWIVSIALCAVAAGCGDDEGGGQQAATTAATTGSTTGTGGGGGTTTSSGMGGAGGATGAGGAGGSSTASTGTSMGTPCAGNTCDFTFNGMGFGMDDGKTVHAGLVIQGVMGLQWEGSDQITNGTFSMQGTGVLNKGQAYYLNYYVDLNDNGGCELTPTDEVWRIMIPPVQENLTITVPYDTNFSNFGCGGFP